MSGNLEELLRIYKLEINEDRKSLGVLETPIVENEQLEFCDNEHQPNNNLQQSSENKENQPLNCDTSTNNNNKPIIEPLDLSSNDGALGKKALQKLLDESGGGRNMLRYGEYSPNNPQLRVSAAPYLGLGEYEQRRLFFQQKRRNDFIQNLSKVQYDGRTSAENDINSYSSSSSSLGGASSVMQNRYLTSAQNALLKPEMDNKPKSILSNRRTGSPRERLLSDLKHSYTPSFMDGFSYQDRSEELERERMKRETYQRELRLQIDEKRRLQTMRDEQERLEQELENKRLEQQLLRMHEEHMVEEQRRCRRDEQMRRHSEDLMRRKHELQTRFRKHTDSESSISNLRNTTAVASSHYSPPITRRNVYTNYTSYVDGQQSSSRYTPSYCHQRKDALNRMDSLGGYESTRRNKFNNNAFSRYDSLSRIDSLNRQDALNRLESLNIQDSNSLSHVQRRHSATQQDLSVIRKSPKLQRRSSSSRFDDTLPIPVLKAHSPVAKELKHSIPFNSSTRSDAVRKLEDKWQIPAVQKNIMNHGDGQGRSILTQLGAIRMQLQQEQLRMDETLRKRDFTQSKAVDFH